MLLSKSPLLQQMKSPVVLQLMGPQVVACLLLHSLYHWQVPAPPLPLMMLPPAPVLPARLALSQVIVWNQKDNKTVINSSH
jgi:hypothetical protein